jgi:microsomal dipeptidase-like Zn-dependent dipeptidase
MAAGGHVIDAIQYSNWTRRHFEEWREGGLTAVGVTIAYHERARETLERLAAWNWRLREHADLIRPIRRAADLDAARDEGRIGVLLGAQNCSPIDDDVGLVQVMADAGLKVMQLTYNNLSLIGAGCAELDDPGISRFGREVIAEMNRVGMVIDMSHSAERTTLEAIELSRRPVAVTHANPRFFKDTPRNKSDKVLAALGETGGMLGFSLYPPHLAHGADTTLEAFTEMVAHAAEIAGVEQLGIGSDMCRGWDGRTIDWMRNGRWRQVPSAERAQFADMPWPTQPGWFRTPADTPNLATGLRARGFSAAEVDGLMGDNWARFLKDALEPDT